MLKCEYKPQTVKDLVKKRLQSDGTRRHVFQLMMQDGGEDYELEIEEPQYGWYGFDDDLMKDYVGQFARALEGRLDMTKDAPGQIMFDFDDEYVVNPRNTPED